jgi:hypothetical protein
MAAFNAEESPLPYILRAQTAVGFRSDPPKYSQIIERKIEFKHLESSI